MRVAQAVALACCGVLALAGGVVLHGRTLVALLIVAGLVAGVAYGVQEDAAGPRGAVALKAAVATTAIGMVATGIGVLAGAAVAVTVTGSALVAAGGLAWLRRWVRRRSGSAAAPARPVPTPASAPMWNRLDPPLPVSLLPTSALCGEWVHSTAALAGRLDPAVRQEMVHRRAEALNELERRDPVGFARWLTAERGLDNNPAAFVRGDRTMGTDAA
jgi:hypothetical protein